MPWHDTRTVFVSHPYTPEGSAKDTVVIENQQTNVTKPRKRTLKNEESHSKATENCSVNSPKCRLIREDGLPSNRTSFFGFPKRFSVSRSAFSGFERLVGYVSFRQPGCTLGNAILTYAVYSGATIRLWTVVVL